MQQQIRESGERPAPATPKTGGSSPAYQEYLVKQGFKEPETVVEEVPTVQEPKEEVSPKQPFMPDALKDKTAVKDKQTRVGLDALNKAFEDEKKALLDQQKIAAKIAEAQLPERERIAQKAQDITEAGELARQQIQAEIDEKQVKLEQAVANLESTRINPDRYWQNKSTGDKIIASIAMVIGGIGAGLTGKRNTAVDIISKAINADIDAQKKEMEKAEKGITASKSVLGELRAQIKDQKLAEQLTLDSMYSAAQKKLDEVKSRFADPAKQAQVDQLIAQIDQKKEKIKADIQAQLAKTTGEAISDDVDLVTKGIMNKVPEKIRQNAFKEYGDYQSDQAARQGLVDTFDEMKKIGFVSANMPFNADASLFDAYNAAIIATLAQSWKGPLSEQEREQVLKKFTINSTNTAKQIESKKKGLLKLVDSNKKSYPILTGFKIIPKNK
jgi:hypothetical protein